MKRLGLVLATAILTVGMAGSAFAQQGTAPDWANKSGGFGIGGNTTLGGTNGINFRTYVSPAFGIAGTLGFAFTSATIEQEEGDPNEVNISVTRFSFGLYGSYKIAFWQRGHLSIVFGGDIESLSTAVDTVAGDTDDSTTNIVLGLGLQGEYFPTQYLSLFAHAGLRIDFLTDDDGDRVAGGVGFDSGTQDLSGMDISLGSDLWGAAGFTVWFK